MVCVIYMVWLDLYASCTVLLTNTVSTERQRMRDQKRGQQSDMKWKGRGERESLKAYLGNVQGQWSNDECCSHRRLLLNLSLSPLALASKAEVTFFL